MTFMSLTFFSATFQASVSCKRNLVTRDLTPHRAVSIITQTPKPGDNMLLFFPNKDYGVWGTSSANFEDACQENDSGQKYENTYTLNIPSLTSTYFVFWSHVSVQLSEYIADILSTSYFYPPRSLTTNNDEQVFLMMPKEWTCSILQDTVTWYFLQSCCSDKKFEENINIPITLKIEFFPVSFIDRILKMLKNLSIIAGSYNITAV